MSYNRVGCQCPAICANCGITTATYGAFCSAVTTSACPATVAVGFTIGEYENISDCSGTPTVTATYPAFEGTVSVAMSPTSNCLYTGDNTIGVSIDTYLCNGTINNTYTHRKIAVTLKGGSLNLFNAPLWNPCADELNEPATSYCAGIGIEIIDQYSTDGTLFNPLFYYSLGFKTHDITDCTEDIPCVTTQGGTAHIYNSSPASNPVTVASIT